MAIRIAMFSNAGFFRPVRALFSPFDGSKFYYCLLKKSFGFYKLKNKNI